jgi:hypothetical protein
MQYLVHSSEWIISAPVLFAVAWVRFNQPPTNRSGTTLVLFSIGLTLYCLLVAVLWLMLITAVGQGVGIGFEKLSLALGRANPRAQVEFAEHAPLVAALLIVAATQVPWVQEIDDKARTFCIELAAIPREADRLALELAQLAEFRPRTERLREKISEVINEAIGAAAEL